MTIMCVLVLEESNFADNIVMTKVSKLCCKNIHRSFEGCRRAFQGYKLTFIYASSGSN